MAPLQARMKYSAKFMEDDNNAYQMKGSVDVDDLTYRMRQALRASKVVLVGTHAPHPRD